MHIGCEHRYPKELDDLSPIEERLIALQAPFGYITKFTVDNKAPSGLNYRKHIKDHIVVFPNKVDDLVVTVLPIRYWKRSRTSTSPGAAQASLALQMSVTFFKSAKPLWGMLWYGWQYEDSSNVPIVILKIMRREEPSIAEKTQTDHIVPATDRGLPENQSTSIEELLDSAQLHAEEHHHFETSPGEPVTAVLGQGHTEPSGDVVYETSSSDMFPLDEPATFSEADKLSFLADAMQTDRHRADETRDDARRFILSHKRAIEIAPLQIYVSALVFSPTRSLIRELFEKEAPDWITLKPSVELNWNACLQTLEGHGGLVNSVAFSADSQRLASGSDDKTVKVWDAETGACVQTLDPTTNSLLSTGIGLLNLDLPTDATLRGVRHSGWGRSTDGIWIVKDGKGMLWLPPEYRGMKSAVVGSTVDIGSHSGRVLVIKFS
ncbi:hypothetical protein B0J13DRAFT_630282 [Dactylonectria estremocensis]|uniref:DUF6570 domain-containing protein n=1 Tax=Dactylonectria estremocensis TaxID=1079267 RepID=A0A9P9DCI2_9HYPO|nr:hypothetical protein B0J13DRAFT_630282 [Dactylonectria estremocensis]